MKKIFFTWCAALALSMIAFSFAQAEEPAPKAPGKTEKAADKGKGGDKPADKPCECKCKDEKKKDDEQPKKDEPRKQYDPVR